MERQPRNNKRDHLVGLRLIVWSYVCIGLIEGPAAMLGYFMVLNDYGIRPSTLLGLVITDGYIPNNTDVYNPNAINYGNTNAGND